MNKRIQLNGAEDIVRKIMLSQLAQVRAMEMMLLGVGNDIARMPHSAELAAILEDIGNAYLDLAEEISASLALAAPAEFG
jgi:uncharacterized protein